MPFVFSVFACSYLAVQLELSEGCLRMGSNQNIKSLSDFGYTFNSVGELRDIKTGGSFVFDAFNGDKKKNQVRYEAIGKAVDKCIYELLVSETKLQKRFIPINKPNVPKGFIFHSPNLETFEKIIIIIHGSGVVRAGQWSRRLIINHSLYSGSQIPYIKRAQELGYGVIVLNTNQNHDEETEEKIEESKDPDSHFSYVWENIVSSLPAKYIAIIAHSYGGVVTVNAATKYHDLTKRVFAVALTDSVHVIQRKVIDWLHNNVLNWSSSHKPLNTRLPASRYDCVVVSAGTTVHEETSWKAFHSVWEFIQTKLEKAQKNDQVNNVVVVEDDVYMNSQPTSEDEQSSVIVIDSSDDDTENNTNKLDEKDEENPQKKDNKDILDRVENPQNKDIRYNVTVEKNPPKEDNNDLTINELDKEHIKHKEL